MISENAPNFETWKYYFFFLWSMIEDVSGFFKLSIDIQKELELELSNGLNKYSQLAEFNFITGYAISIFPYEFGDYKELEIKGKQMLKKAFEMNKSNPIYEMVYLGSKNLNKREESLYKKACVNSKQILKIKYQGKGLLNEYYNQVFNRV